MKVSKQDILTTTRELLKRIRGDRTQGMVNQKLGHSFNQMYRWETGRTRIKWREFVGLCSVCKVDLPIALNKGLLYFDDTDRADKIICHLIGKRKISEISKTLGMSRFSLSDWATGKSDPPLHEMLKIFKHFDMLLFTLEQLIGTPMIPSLEKEHALRKKQLDVYYQNPLAGAVLMCLELKDYRDLKTHQSGLISKKLGISEEEENQCLKALQHAGALEFKKGKYLKHSSQVSIRGNFEGERSVRSYWVQKGLEMDGCRKGPSKSSNFGFSIFSVNEDKEKRIRQALMDFASLVSKIAREPDDGGKNLNVFTVQLYDPSHIPALAPPGKDDK